MGLPSARVVKLCTESGGLWDLANNRCVSREAVTMPRIANPPVGGLGLTRRPAGSLSGLTIGGSRMDPVISRSLGGDILREGANIGLTVLGEYLRARLIPGGSSGGTTTDSQIPGNLVPTTSSATCPDGSFPLPGFGCVDLIPGGGVSGGGMVLNTGEAVNGRFGAGQVPVQVSRNTRRCARGMVLGIDGVCYDKGAISNSERFWPRGRRPLLTGGDMRAISRASRAAKRMKAKQGDLMSLGLLPRPKRAPSHGKGCQCSSCVRISAARNGS